MIIQYNYKNVDFYKPESVEFWEVMNECICKTEGWFFVYSYSDAYMKAHTDLKEWLRSSIVLTCRVPVIRESEKFFDRLVLHDNAD